MPATVATAQTARKHHRCSWCDKPIEIGETYVRWRSFDAGDACTVRCHHECDSAWQFAANEEGGYELWPGEAHPRGLYRDEDGCVWSPDGTLQRTAATDGA